MKHHFDRTLVFLAVFIVAVMTLLLFFENAYMASSEYYQTLSNRCDGSSCCVSSVAIMEKNGYRAMEQECDQGYEKNMLRCIDSYIWCEPVAEMTRP